ncbi:MAG: hypothetical protein LCH30_04160 [Proteobacteria bacterium]|nr:hypothetical protein [Pseudomonadota bacterium]
MAITVRVVKTDNYYYFVLISEQVIPPGLMNRFKALCKEKQSIKSKTSEMELLNFSIEGKKEEIQQFFQSLLQCGAVYKRVKCCWQKDSKVKYSIELHPKNPKRLASLQTKVNKIKSQLPNVNFEYFPFTQILEIPIFIKPAIVLALLKILIEDSGFKQKYSFIIENERLERAYKVYINKPNYIQIDNALLNQFEFDGYVDPLSGQPEKPIPEPTSVAMLKDAVKHALQNYQKWYKGEREPEGKPYRGKENGFFTRWRHTKNGQRDAKELYKKIQSKNSAEEINSEIDTFLNQYKNGQAIHVHSFASFLLDNLNQFHDSPWQHLQPNKKTNKYEYTRALSKS